MIPGMKKEQQETEVYAAALPLSSAVRTGLEPATPCVTGMYSNQAELPHLEIMIANVPKQNSFPFAVAKLQPFFLPTKFFAIFFHIFFIPPVFPREITENPPGSLRNFPTNSRISRNFPISSYPCLSSLPGSALAGYEKRATGNRSLRCCSSSLLGGADGT